MIAVVLHKTGIQGKTYRIATEEDMKIFRKAEEYLKIKEEELREKWGMEPVPDENLHQQEL